MEDGIDHSGVMGILDDAGIGMPAYYRVAYPAQGATSASTSARLNGSACPSAIPTCSSERWP